MSLFFLPLLTSLLILSCSQVSLGGVGLGGKDKDDLYGGVSDETAIATVHRALERGINFIDTSPLCECRHVCIHDAT